MTERDKIMREYLQSGLAGIELTERQKEKLQAALATELFRSRRGWQHTLVSRVSGFLENTYEVSLAPVAATMAILLVVGISSFGLHLRPEPGRIEPVTYTQQIIRGTDGDVVVTYIPVNGGNQDVKDKVKR